MVDLGGGGVMIGGTGLQWLVWIQLLVMILLIVLLYCFSLYSLEVGDGDVRVSVSGGGVALLFGREGEGAADAENNLSVDRETSFLQTPLKVVGSSSIPGEISTAGNSNRRIVRSQNGTEGDAASVKDFSSNHAVTETPHHHPCAIFKFAREAFLKCLGLDCMAETSNSRKQGKID